MGDFGTAPDLGLGYDYGDFTSGFSGGNPFTTPPTAGNRQLISASWSGTGNYPSSWSSAYNASQARRQQSAGGGGGGGGKGGGGGATGAPVIPGGSGLFGGQGGGASQRFTPFSDTAGPMTATSGIWTPEEKPFSLGPTPSWKPEKTFGEWAGDFVTAIAPAVIAACDIRLKTDIAPLENTEVNDALADIAFFVKEIRECA